MEEKKNNALEKVENISQQVQSDSEPIERQETDAGRRIKQEKVRSKKAIRQQKIREKERIKQERERALAEKRVEKARIIAHKKAERQKMKAMALREKNRRKAQLKERKMQLKAERIAREQALKSESKAERNRRLQLEKQAKREQKLAMHKARTERKRQLLMQKRAKKEERNRARAQRRKDNRGVGGYLAAIISLGIATLVLASVLTFTFLMPTANDNMLEANYQKSFYDTVEQVDNIDINMSKILATKDSGAIQKYLLDTAINSELAENDLQQLPLQDESKYYTTKLINQIGDYAKYLNNKIISGEKITSEDMDNLQSLYLANKTFKDALQKMMGAMGVDYSFSSMIGGGNGDLVISNFNELQNLSVQYPELIYDGPFSDGQQNREIKGLKGAEITAQNAMDKFSEIFAEYKLKDVMNVGETVGDINCFNVQGQVEDNILYAQISKTGGKLIMFSFAGSCLDSVKDQDYAIEKATEFLSGLDLKDMKPVWINLANSVYTINFAYEKDGVIVYSDLVKVRVCAETGMVIGLEARSYYQNHTDRVISSPSISKHQAKNCISDSIEVDSIRLAVVPIGTKSEKLCYEIFGDKDGSTYYIYVDAVTGRQVEMFKVIETTEGQLLI